MTKREQVVKVAEKLVAKGRVDSAIKEYLKVLKENPNDVSTLNRLGDLYARISSIDDAVRLFTQIAEQYTEDGFLVKAIAIYKKIIKLDPTRLQVYESLAALYHKQGLTTEARTQYQVLGDYYLKHHDNAAAINIYQKMAELEPDNPSHHLKLAELFQQGQLWEKALRSYRTIAELMLQHGRVDEAVRVYQRAIEVHSDDLGFITDAVMGIKDAGHTGAAARLLASAVARNPQAEKVARLAGLRQASGDPRETLPPPRAAAPAPAAPTRPSPPRPAPPPPAPREEEFLVLDLDEGPSGSLVSPPEDMQEPGSAFLRPPPAKPPESLPQRLGPAALEPDAWTQEPPEPAAAEAADVESSGSWGSDSSISGFSFEMPDLTVPAEEAAAPPAGEPFQLDLEEEEAPLPWEEPPPPPEPEEELAATEPSSELELDLAQLEIEPLDEEVPAPAFEQPSFAETSLGTASEDTGFELELEDEGAAAPWETPAIGLPPAIPVEPPRPPVAEAAPAPPAPPEEPRLQDLLAEAEVFSKYALEEKAVERLDQVLARDPTHVEALQLLVDLHVRSGDVAKVESAVRRLRRAIEARNAPEVWEKVQARLVRAGMAPGAAAAPPPRPVQDERVSQLIRSLEAPAARPQPKPPAPPPPKPAAAPPAARPAEPPPPTARPVAPPPAAKPAAPTAPKPAAPPPAATPPAPPAAAKPAPPPAKPEARPAGRTKASVDDALAAITSGLLEKPAAKPRSVKPPAAARPAVPASPAAPSPPAAAAPPPAAAAAPPPAPPSVAPPAGPHFDEGVFEEELPDIVLPEERAPAPGGVPDLDDTGMDWLREEPAGKKAAPDALFDEEDEFFDLAAELESELGVEDGKLGGEILAHSEEPTLEEIVEGFKKGVAENLSAEDYDTHYNLGIAYREMGLLDEAIGEFQLAAKDPGHLVDCCSMLGVSFLEKGLPELAVKWYQRGLTAPGMKEEVMLSLLYDMGNVYLAMGDMAAAKKTFVELYGVNSNYRDVVAKLEELGR